jgi:hypothetical protein
MIYFVQFVQDGIVGDSDASKEKETGQEKSTLLSANEKARKFIINTFCIHSVQTNISCTVHFLSNSVKIVIF